MPSHNTEGNKVLMNYYGENESSDLGSDHTDMNEDASLDYF